MPEENKKMSDFKDDNLDFHPDMNHEERRFNDNHFMEHDRDFYMMMQKHRKPDAADKGST
jgi:hypothetical protein